MQRDPKLKTVIYDKLSAAGESHRKVRCVIRNPQLNDSLGQVDHLILNMTGVVTNNLLITKKILFSQKEYCHQDPNATEQNRKNDHQFEELLKDAGQEGKNARNFLLAMHLCNSQIFIKPGYPVQPNPAEKAATAFAQQYNFTSIDAEESRSLDDGRGRFEDIRLNIGKPTKRIQELGETNNYVILRCYVHDSNRKIFTVVALKTGEPGRNKAWSLESEDKNAEVLIISKGQDDMWKYIDERKSPNKDVISNLTKKAKSSGLKIVIYGVKKMTLQAWREHQKAVNAHMLGRDVDRVAEEQRRVETGLQLLGVLTLQDTLPKNIIEQLKFYRASRMQIWLVSDAEKNYSVEVAKQVRLIDEQQRPVQMLEPDDFNEDFVAKLKKQQKKQKKEKKASVAIMNAKFFKVFYEYRKKNEILFKQLLHVLMGYDFVMFFEISGEQKEDVVSLIRAYDNKIVTLAIGNTISDIGMLQRAHIGIGLQNAQASQLQRVADYSLSEFKQIHLLVFGYGREEYRKNCTVVLYIIYKSIIIAFPQFWFGFFIIFSPQSLFEQVLVHLYEPLFTLLPIIIFGSFDQNFKRSKLTFSPMLYQTGHDNYYFRLSHFGYLVLQFGLYSLYLTLLSIFVFDVGTYKEHFNFGIVVAGAALFQLIVLMVTLRIVSISNSFSYQTILIMAGSVALSLGAFFLLSQSSFSLQATFSETIFTYQFYFMVLVIFTTFIFDCLCFRYIYVNQEKKYIPDFDMRYDMQNNLRG